MTLAGNALSFMVYGTSNDNQVRQMGGYFTNAAISQGGPDLDTATFNKARENMLHIYSTTGINTREEAYALANQLFAEGRISEAEVVSMHQGFNMLFDDNGFSQAEQLLEGVNLGRGSANTPDPNKPAVAFTGTAPVPKPVAGSAINRPSTNISFATPIDQNNFQGAVQ